MIQDRILVCASCSTPFLWTPAEQRLDNKQLAHCPGCRYLLPSEGRRRGVVKFYSLRKHWGFVTQPDGAELFFHRSGLALGDEPPLREGELVEFAVQQSARGPQAVDLRRPG